MITVEIKIPVLKDTLDFQLDENVAIRHLIEEINGIMNKRYSGDMPIDASDFVMCSDKSILDMDATLYQNGVCEGDTLMLV